MLHLALSKNKIKFPFVYEVLVWSLYVCMYKYEYYLGISGAFGSLRQNLPHPQLILYAVVLTLYTIPLYRWLAPTLLNSKKYKKLALITILYLWFAPKIGNFIVDFLFLKLNADNGLVHFYVKQYQLSHIRATHFLGWDLKILVTDFVAFVSITAMRFAFESEQKKYLLEKANFQLQLESLKAQLNPHFLFNTLNSIYGMSITGSKETPEFILRLSDMMRYILYDCQHLKVSLTKDIAFLKNYFEMEKKRYPSSDIELKINEDVED